MIINNSIEELIDDIYRVFDAKGWDIKADLPLHMCGFSVMATSWVLLTRNQLMFELAYFWGFGGAVQALLTPDPSGILNHFYLFSFMVSISESLNFYKTFTITFKDKTLF